MPVRVGLKTIQAWHNDNMEKQICAFEEENAPKGQIVCYGPSALSNARKIRSFLYLDGSGFPRSILRKAGLYPVPSPPEPLILHEPEGSLWRLRADLTVSLRVRDEIAASQPAAHTAPDILMSVR